MKLRQVSSRDAVALCDLMEELGYPAEPLSLAERLKRIEGDASYSAWTVESDEGGLVGLAGGHLIYPFEEDARVAQLMILVVSETTQGCGVGRSLVEAFEGWAFDSGAGRAVVTSGAWRGDAHEFYRHMGFMETGKRFGKSLRGLRDKSE